MSVEYKSQVLPFDSPHRNHRKPQSNDESKPHYSRSFGRSEAESIPESIARGCSCRCNSKHSDAASEFKIMLQCSIDFVADEDAYLLTIPMRELLTTVFQNPREENISLTCRP